jgi:4-oxalocrotonate tautomerase
MRFASVIPELPARAYKSNLLVQGPAMPYINIQITREGVTAAQKNELIKGTTELMVRVLNKDPATTFVLIDEVDTDNWGIAGQSVTALRLHKKSHPGLR